MGTFCVAVIFAGFTGGFIWWVRCQASPLARLVYLIHLIWQTQSSRIFVWWRKSLNRNLILVVLYKGCKTSGPVSDRYCQSFFPQKHYWYSLVHNGSNRVWRPGPRVPSEGRNKKSSSRWVLFHFKILSIFRISVFDSEFKSIDEFLYWWGETSPRTNNDTE